MYQIFIALAMIIFLNWALYKNGETNERIECEHAYDDINKVINPGNEVNPENIENSTNLNSTKSHTKLESQTKDMAGVCLFHVMKWISNYVAYVISEAKAHWKIHLMSLMLLRRLLKQVLEWTN
jgi:hypothetical protein